VQDKPIRAGARLFSEGGQFLPAAKGSNPRRRYQLEVAELLRGRDVALRSLTEHIDTRTAAGKMLYAVLGAVAQFERDVLRERTVAGMKAAKKRGTHVGRPRALSGSRLAEAQRMLAAGKSQVETARILRVSRATMQRA
jgi:DNA invertase Pin-like site-specific DNA recombinase